MLNSEQLKVQRSPTNSNQLHCTSLNQVVTKQNGANLMDEIKQAKNSIQMRNWENMILDRQSSGLTVEQWCARENISKSVYYYHLRKVRQSYCEQIPVAVADLSESISSADPSVRISSEKIKVEITGTVSGDMLSAIIRALKC